MMKIFGLLFLLALFFSCASQKEVAQNKKGRCAIKDSAQYELIVFDSGFDFWLASHQSVAHQHSESYYQSMNHQYAIEWINSYIDYSLNRNYGFDFNYKLYMYFKFFEDTNRMQLIPGNRNRY